MNTTTKIAPVAFIKDVWVELQKVRWPSKQEAVKLTAIVIGVSVAVSLFIGFFDLVFTEVTRIIIP